MTTWAKNLFKKLFLDRIPSGTIVPMFGSNRGRRWIIGSGNHGHWLGRSEPAVQAAFKKHVKKGDVVYDIGAHAGFYTLLASSLAGSEGRIYAFEPLPENFKNLLAHLRINGVKNSQAYQTAVSEKSGKLFFERGGNTYTGRISEKGSVQVDVVSIDDLVEKQKIPLPDFVKMDVEGHELAVLKGMSKTLEMKRRIIIEMEANSSRADVFGFLESRGYIIERLDQNNVICVR